MVYYPSTLKRADEIKKEYRRLTEDLGWQGFKAKDKLASDYNRSIKSIEWYIYGKWETD